VDEEEDPDDTSSSLVRSGKLALTFAEMGTFVKDIEARPTERLVDDLAGLMALPEAKYQLVVMVLRKKTQPGEAEHSIVLDRLKELQTSAEDPSVRSRIRAFLAKSTP